MKLGYTPKHNYFRTPQAPERSFPIEIRITLIY